MLSLIRASITEAYEPATTNTEERERRREKGADDSAAVNNERAKTPLLHSTASTYFL
jgi:hypothetical protein